LKKGRIVNAAFSSSGEAVQSAYSNNVAGMIEGTDEELKKQFVLITAHYDHIGAGKEGGGLYTPQDSIFNGARDNAMGTAALLSAAQAIGQQPTKRSVLFLAVTAEEIGLLGSEYYAEHPLLPLKQMVFNLNTDGAGYDDVTAISVIGYGRTGTDAHFEAAAKMVGLKVVQNPAPEAGLFDRSDNVSFSKVGIPSATLSPGITGFSQEIMSRYHQITDEAATLDFDYVLKYCQSFAHTARLIGDAAEAPQWMEGDKYEEVGKKLYGSKE
ncbi:MAG: M28 family peptidase, partial [Bacteroidota bacterium]